MATIQEATLGQFKSWKRYIEALWRYIEALHNLTSPWAVANHLLFQNPFS